MARVRVGLSHRKEKHMTITYLIIPLLIALLYGLINSTERALTRREQPVELDARIIDHRSRM